MRAPVAGIKQPIVFDASFNVECVAQDPFGAWLASAIPRLTTRE